MPTSSSGNASGPKIPKPSAEVVDRFRRAVGDDPRASLRPMFGNLAAFTNGYLFAGLFGEDVFVRVDAPGHAAILADGGRPFAPMPDRPMRGYAILPTAEATDEPRLRTRIEASLAYTLTLPPKAPKAARPKTSKPKAGPGGKA